MRILEHTVLEDEQGQTLRKLVPRVFGLSSHAFRRLKVQGGIRVNGVPEHVTHTVIAGDRLTVHLASEPVLSGAAADPCPDATGASRDRLVLYLDDDLIIADKPAPLATLPGRFDRGDTLRERLAQCLGTDPEAPYHPVNRLDKGTSGLLCIARHDHAQYLLTQALHSGLFVREYLAVTEGIPSPPFSRIDRPIARTGSGARRMVAADGKPAVTDYTVLYAETETGRALVRLNLRTGRTHQIRVHLSSIGCPLVGDYLYGTPHPQLPDRFALHSAHLRCLQPVIGEQIDLTSPFPASLSGLFRYPEKACACIAFAGH